MKLLLASLLLSLPFGVVWAEQVKVPSVSLTLPTENVDGSSLIDLAGTRLYAGFASRAYSASVQNSDPTTTTFTNAVFDLPSAGFVAGDVVSVYVAATAYDSAGNESGFSNEKLFQGVVIDDVAPNPPTITVIVTVEVVIGGGSVVLTEVVSP